MRGTVVERQVSLKGLGTGMPLSADPRSGEPRTADADVGAGLVDPARRMRSFAAVAERATRLRLLSIVGAVDDDPGAKAEAERDEVAVLLDLALRPAASDRDYEVKRSTFACLPTGRGDNLHALLDAALDADAARLRARRRRHRDAPSACLVR